MKPSDFKGLFHKSSVTVVKIDNPFDDHYVITLQPNSQTTWTAGEHAVFYLPDMKERGRRWRAFSVASAPEEGVILIGTRTGAVPSSFKKHLVNMKIGSRIGMIGPFGWFKFHDEQTPVVLISGGVGVTPIRAMVKSLSANRRRGPVDLICGNTGRLLFEQDLRDKAVEVPLIRYSAPTSVEETLREITAAVQRHGNTARYYISGSPSMILSVRKDLRNQGIMRSHIIFDPFIGYRRQKK